MEKSAPPESRAPAESPGPAAPPAERPEAIADLLLREGYVSKPQVEYARRVRAKLSERRPLLGVLEELGSVTADQVREALRVHRPAVPIGALLVELGLLRESDLQAALAIQSEASPKKKLGQVLIEQQLVSEDRLLEVLSFQLGYPLVDPAAGELDPELARRASIRWCASHAFVPVGEQDGAVVVAFADPLDAEALEIARKNFGANLVRAIARRGAIQTAVSRLGVGSADTAETAVDESTIVGLVNGLVRTAIEEDISDIHLEPMKDRLRVRFRQDGVLIPHRDLPVETAAGIANRIKILAGADIAERRRHQDGRIQFEDPSGPIDIRVSIYATVHGEKFVLRLLNRKRTLLRLDELGISPRTLLRFREEALHTPSGVVIITGPTGSGKTTTLYGAIADINDVHTSIITAEDPVEYLIDGIAQCSINAKINRTYEETLRHIVRQDPDVIVIGEIRDRFSAETAIQAALTGHKVLTTFHTEDSIGGLLRLLNMEIEAFLISSTVVSVVAQRLVRRICEGCAEPHQPTPLELFRLAYAPADVAGATFRRGRGCARCRYTGYKGRLVVFELLVLNEPVRDAILARRTSHEIRRISTESTGLVSLLEDGILKAARGQTTLEEVTRDLPRLAKPRPLAALRRLVGEEA
jgi:type IV pilus assembly protein PilB